MGKKSIVHNLQLIIPGVDKNGALKTWAHFSIDDRYWRHLISGLGTSSTSAPPAPPPTPSKERTHQSPLPPRQPPPSAPTPPESARARVVPSTTPPARAASSPPMRAYNNYGVGKTRKYSMRILNLSGEATEREVKTNYQKIARIYHQDKHRPSSTGMSPNQADE